MGLALSLTTGITRDFPATILISASSFSVLQALSNHQYSFYHDIAPLTTTSYPHVRFGFLRN